MKFLAIPCFLVLAFTAQQRAEDPSPEDTNPSRESTAEFDGLIEANRVVYLSTPVDGLLETVAVERGDVVQKGQAIANLESKVEKAALAIAKAQTELLGELKKQEARLEYSSTKLANDQELHRKGILSSDLLDQSRTEKLLSEAGLVEAQEKLSLAVLGQRRAEAALDLRTIRCPIDGVVVDRLLSPGEIVTRQYQSKIVAVAELDPLRVDVILPVEVFGRIAVGMKADVKPRILPGRDFEAEVKSVDPVINAASGTFRVRLEMPNPDNRLPAGLKCRVRFLEPTVMDGLRHRRVKKTAKDEEKTADE